MAKARRAKRYTYFRLRGDAPHVLRKLHVLRLFLARAYLDKAYGPGTYSIIEKPQ